MSRLRVASRQSKLAFLFRHHTEIRPLVRSMLDAAVGEPAELGLPFAVAVECLIDRQRIGRACRRVSVVVHQGRTARPLGRISSMSRFESDDRSMTPACDFCILRIRMFPAKRQ